MVRCLRVDKSGRLPTAGVHTGISVGVLAGMIHPWIPMPLLRYFVALSALVCLVSGFVPLIVRPAAIGHLIQFFFPFLPSALGGVGRRFAVEVFDVAFASHARPTDGCGSGSLRSGEKQESGHKKRDADASLYVSCFSSHAQSGWNTRT